MYIFLISLISWIFPLISPDLKNKPEIIFDGKDVSQLRAYKSDLFPDDAWEVSEGAIKTKTIKNNVDLVTRNRYKDFDLSFEWKVSKAGNSGVFFHVQEDFSHQSGNGNSPNWLQNFEFQILDDIDFPDKTPNRSAGSVYDLITPENKSLKPVGAYNTARIIVKKAKVTHYINGRKIIQYTIGSPEMNQLIAKSKFKDKKDFGAYKEGHIMFQHHGQEVWYKNITIKKL